MRKTKTILLAAFLSILPATSHAADAPRISYDAHSFIIDNNPTLIYSGSFHYFRCPKPLWRERFKKLKEAGFNTVETYVAWNWHEQTPPANPEDFSKVDLVDLNDWMTMAEDEFGLNTIIRPGPYICAEWEGGGYPQWLVTKKPANVQGMWFRGNDPEYLAWCKHWYTAVAKVAVNHQITHRAPGKAGMILWQLENEYNYDGAHNDKIKLDQLLFLGKLSKDLGIDIPLFTCVSHNATLMKDEWMKQNVIETANQYPGMDLEGMTRGISYLRTYQPEKPRMITELQGGWFSSTGNPRLSDQMGMPAMQIQRVTLLAWEKGFTSTNYYMAFGGTNLNDWNAEGITATYDYNAPLREAGGVTDRFLAVKGMADFLKAHADGLVRSKEQDINVIEKKDGQVHVAVRVAEDGSQFIFVRTDDRDGPHSGTIRYDLANGVVAPITIIHYNLPATGSMVCWLPKDVHDDSQGGLWYPKMPEAPKRPNKLPAPIEITSIKRKYDAVPEESAFKPVPKGSSEEDLGIYDRRTLVYRTRVNLDSYTEAGKGGASLSIRVPGRDDCSVYLNGARVPREAREGGIETFKFSDVKPGDNEVVVVYENASRPNGGNGMEHRGGMQTAFFASSAATGKQINGWAEKLIKSPEDQSLVAEDIDARNWKKTSVNEDDGDMAEHQTAVYRATIEVTADEISAGRQVVFGRIDELGWVFVNGKLVGKSTDWAEPMRCTVTEQLKPGKNSIAVIVQNEQGVGGLARGVSLQPSGIAKGQTSETAQWQMAPGTAGSLANWSADSVDDSQWETVQIEGGPIKADVNAPLAWYRASFELPDADSHLFIPYKARLNINGNAFLYLNGQAIGRYWNTGPQWDFYLPECWLKHGAGQKNVLTIAVRGLDTPEVRSMTVMPYEDQAEVK